MTQDRLSSMSILNIENKNLYLNKDIDEIAMKKTTEKYCCILIFIQKPRGV